MSKRITNVKSNTSAKKILAVVAVVLVAALIVGVVAVYNIIDSGFAMRHQVAMKSENYEISSAMMNYYFNTLYQNYSSTYASMGSLDTSKPLDEQDYIKGEQTWYDFFMDMTKNNVRQLLVLCEAAKADGFKLEDDDSHDHSADETLATIESMAKTYGVTLNYYLENVYGKGVNEKVFRECYEISEIASHYSEHMTEGYDFSEDDWNTYYKENKDTFNKVDYLSYTFKVEKAEVEKDATDDDKAAAEALDKEEAARLEKIASELAATADADAFKAYVENYLRTDLYKDKTEAELEKEKIDIDEEIADLLTEGATNSTTSDLNKWLFDTATAANATKVIKSTDGFSFTVAMILAADGSDLEDDCIYRDTYKLKNFRYIPFVNSEYKDNADDAKAAAEAAMNRYEEKATEEEFAKLADEYMEENANGGLAEGVDKGAIGDSVDAWLYDSARKAGDCELIQVADKGTYLIYYLGDGDIKWQAQADNALINDKYTEEYGALEDKYMVKTVAKGLELVSEVSAG